MPKRLIARAAAEQEPRPACAPKQRSIALVELITTAALAVSTAIAVTAVSIGIARAEGVVAVTMGDGTPWTVALSMVLLLAAMGGVTAVVVAAPDYD